MVENSLNDNKIIRMMKIAKVDLPDILGLYFIIDQI